MTLPPARTRRSALPRARRKALRYQSELKRLETIRIEGNPFHSPKKLFENALDHFPRQMKASERQAILWSLFYRQMYARFQGMSPETASRLKKIFQMREKMQRTLHAFENQQPVSPADVQEALSYCRELANQSLRILEFHETASERTNLTRIRSASDISRAGKRIATDIIQIRRLQQEMPMKENPLASRTPNGARFQTLEIPRPSQKAKHKQGLDEMLGGILTRGLRRQYDLKLVTVLGRMNPLLREERTAREWMDLHHNPLH